MNDTYINYKKNLFYTLVQPIFFKIKHFFIFAVDNF